MDEKHDMINSFRLGTSGSVGYLSARALRTIEGQKVLSADFTLKVKLLLCYHVLYGRQYIIGSLHYFIISTFT